MKDNILKYIAISFCTVLFLSSCSMKNATQKQKFVSKPFQSDSVDRDRLSKLHSIFLLPPHTYAASVACADQVGSYDLVKEAFKGELGLKLVTDDSVFDPSWQAKAMTLSDTITLAQNHNADGVMVIELHACQERIGSRVGVTQPAHVSFVVKLVDTVNSSEIWKGTYAMKDVSLSENLFHIKDRIHTGPGWASASDLMKYGLRLAAKELEQQRTSAFLVKE